MATETRVSQGALLVINKPSPQTRVSQDALLVINKPSPETRVSQLALLLIIPLETHQGTGADSGLASESGAGALTASGSASASALASEAASGERVSASRVDITLKEHNGQISLELSTDQIILFLSPSDVTLTAQ